MSKGQTADRLAHRARLGPVGAQELQPRRGGEEEVPHLDLGTGRTARRNRLANAPAIDGDRPGMILTSVTGLDTKARHRADGRKRFAAETQCADG
jgi:hypothetical protein